MAELTFMTRPIQRLFTETSNASQKSGIQSFTHSAFDSSHLSYPLVTSSNSNHAVYRTQAGQDAGYCAVYGKSMAFSNVGTTTYMMSTTPKLKNFTLLIECQVEILVQVHWAI